MKKIVSVFMVALFLLATSSICSAQKKIIVAGTGASQQLLRVLAEAFEKANPGTKIEVPDSIDSSGGIRAAAKGLCDLGRVARPIKEKEKKYNLNYRLFACSPLVFVVNKSVKGVSNLSTEQIIGIYSGKITGWSEVGGQKTKIYVTNREAGDSARRTLKKYLPGFKEIKEYAGFTTYCVSETVKTIIEHKNTIGYVSLPTVKGTDLRVLKINGVYPSVENIQNGTYKIATPYGLVWKGELTGLAKAFFDFLFSPKAQKIVIENGAVFVP